MMLANYVSDCISESSMYECKMMSCNYVSDCICLRI